MTTSLYERYISGISLYRAKKEETVDTTNHLLRDKSYSRAKIFNSSLPSVLLKLSHISDLGGFSHFPIFPYQLVLGKMRKWENLAQFSHFPISPCPISPWKNAKMEKSGRIFSFSNFSMSNFFLEKCENGNIVPDFRIFPYFHVQFFLGKM